MRGTRQCEVRVDRGVAAGLEVHIEHRVIAATVDREAFRAGACIGNSIRAKRMAFSTLRDRIGPRPGQVGEDLGRNTGQGARDQILVDFEFRNVPIDLGRPSGHARRRARWRIARPLDRSNARRRARSLHRSARMPAFLLGTRDCGKTLARDAHGHQLVRRVEEHGDAAGGLHPARSRRGDRRSARAPRAHALSRSGARRAVGLRHRRRLPARAGRVLAQPASTGARRRRG